MSRHTRICPWCGQDLIVPNEITTLQCKPGVRAILMRLYRAKGQLVPYEAFNALSIVSLRVYMGQAREALRDAGAPWHITTTYYEGYRMEPGAENAHKDRTPQRPKALPT